MARPGLEPETCGTERQPLGHQGVRRRLRISQLTPTAVFIQSYRQKMWVQSMWPVLHPLHICRFCALGSKQSDFDDNDLSNAGRHLLTMA
ncbi:hypothetical protein CEXT_100281 [Caerostris extrusa]|uniref:Uncharacterized protein n=1 Tax=Caerostris extrusa TaxID=172846 RepID=A0AAV4PBH3_CAEEX|nr:hypothetical protein CEXT_100281 [Caerostris extrusa]